MGQSITSEAKFRQRVIKYLNKNGVTEASNRFHCSRQVIYNWRKRYDGKSWKSLIEHSHRPKSHPKDYSSIDFLKKLIKYFPFRIIEIQTDNGTEWTAALITNEINKKTLFERGLEENSSEDTI